MGNNTNFPEFLWVLMNNKENVIIFSFLYKYYYAII